MPSLRRCLEVLGIPPGASKEHIKQTYHDLVKVWHPDRFAHDTRLQAQAQEKLKEINEAYEALVSGRFAQERAFSKQAHAKEDRMMPVVSFLVLVTAIAILSLIFFTFGSSIEHPIHNQKVLRESA